MNAIYTQVKLPAKPTIPEDEADADTQAQLVAAKEARQLAKGQRREKVKEAAKRARISVALQEAVLSNFVSALGQSFLGTYLSLDCSFVDSPMHFRTNCAASPQSRPGSGPHQAHQQPHLRTRRKNAKIGQSNR